MPEAAKHMLQYKKNKLLLDSPVFEVDKCDHLDWLVTILFYTALHLVDKRLDDIGESPHDRNSNHTERNRRVNAFLPKEVASRYQVLYSNSRKARYECIPFDIDRVSNLRLCLDKIEQNIMQPIRE